VLDEDRALVAVWQTSAFDRRGNAPHDRDMAERATKEVLLRLRRVRELELRRALSLTRAARAETRRAGAAAEAARRALEAQLERAAGRRVRPWSGARSAGRLAQAEGFEQALRRRLLDARQIERKAQAALDAAEAQLAEAQRALGDALHARQRSEALAASERAADLRARERREQAEVEDRYRSPGRPRPSPSR
jgi:hypothetical protein